MPGACKVHNPSRKHIYIYIIEQIFLKVSAISVLKNTEIAEGEQLRMLLTTKNTGKNFPQFLKLQAQEFRGQGIGEKPTNPKSL